MSLLAKILKSVNPYYEFAMANKPQPETQKLKRLRLSFLSACVILASLVFWLQLGAGAWRLTIGACVMAFSIIATIIGAFYIRAKSAADDSRGDRGA